MTAPKPTPSDVERARDFLDGAWVDVDAPLRLAAEFAAVRERATFSALEQAADLANEHECHAVSQRIRALLPPSPKTEEPRVAHPGLTVTGQAPPLCTQCHTRLMLAMWERPGGPPGNGWRCPRCNPLPPEVPR